MRRRFISLALPLLAIALGSGCVVETNTNPFGGTVTLSGSWQINGVQADASNCAAAGISQVELRILDSSAANPQSYQTWNCADGFFDARTDALLPRLFHGTYYTQWFAWDAGGGEVGRSTPLLLDVTIDSDAGLAPPNFVTGPIGFDPTLGGSVTIHGSWLINSGPADATSCGATGLDSVELRILEDGGTGQYSYQTWACATGSFDGRTDATLPRLAAGRYNTQWFAYDASGAELGRSTPLLLDVSSVTDAGLASPDFTVELPAPELDVTLSWAQDATAAPVYGTCTEAAVGDFFFALNNAAGALVTDSNSVVGADAAGRIPCANSLSFTDLTPGTYSLYIDGAALDGTKWMATCDALIVDTGVVSYDCFVDQA
ncbi:MAG: hypothetical protein GXP55_21115 [Deltaproteobacteria bacterium]|nr:hypothetical protein [Deltaproteobacteria bacterium]